MWRWTSPNSLYGLSGRKATVEEEDDDEELDGARLELQSEVSVHSLHERFVPML